MSIRSLRLSLGLLLTLTLCGAAFAQDEGPYLGAGAGQSKVADPGSCSDLVGLFNPGYSCSLTDTDTGWKIFGGYQINRNFALEASYVDLGAAKLQANGIAIGVPVALTAKFATTGVSFDAVISAPISESFSLFGRAGVFAWSLKATANASSGAVASNQSDSTSGNSLDFGVGARYDFNKNVGARIEFQRFTKIGDDATTGGTSDIDLISASLIYVFR